MKTVTKKEGVFSMPKAERKFHFTKFIAQNTKIVEKGLHWKS